MLIEYCDNKSLATPFFSMAPQYVPMPPCTFAKKIFCKCFFYNKIACGLPRRYSCRIIANRYIFISSSTIIVICKMIPPPGVEPQQENFPDRLSFLRAQQLWYERTLEYRRRLINETARKREEYERLKKIYIENQRKT